MRPVVAGGPAVPPNQEEVAKRSNPRGVEIDSRSRFNAAALGMPSHNCHFTWRSRFREFLTAPSRLGASATRAPPDPLSARKPPTERKFSMPYVTVGKENGANIDIYYKDWGSGQPIVFSHGWPLSADDWDAQMLFFLSKGFRVIATDRRGHGRSTQTGGGHDMDHYADDLKAVTDHLKLKDAIHVGHSTGGGQVVHYLGRHGDQNVAKAAIISAVPPLMVKTPANPLGLPKSVFDDLQAQLAANRAKFYYDVPAGPFYGFNRPGVKTIEPLVWN